MSAPELYTLPAAALLVAAGAWRLRTDRETSSFTMLGSGLTLALLPSLLLALDEPVSLRGALVGAAAVLVLAAGVQQRLAAPFVLGAVSTGVLALRHLRAGRRRGPPLGLPRRGRAGPARGRGHLGGAAAATWRPPAATSTALR